MSATITGTRSIGELGSEIYERLAPIIETAENIGKAVVIDVDSGDYEIADEKIEAADRLEQRRAPGRFYYMLVGYDAGGSMGGGINRVIRS